MLHDLDPPPWSFPHPSIAQPPLGCQGMVLRVPRAPGSPLKPLPTNVVPGSILSTNTAVPREQPLDGVGVSRVCGVFAEPE